LKRLIAATAELAADHGRADDEYRRSVKYGAQEVRASSPKGPPTSSWSRRRQHSGRPLLHDIESRGGRNVCVLGYDVADARSLNERSST